MIPVNDGVRKLLIQAVESELEQLEIEALIPQADKSNLWTDAEYATMIAQFKFIREDLVKGRLIVFDTRPQCMNVDHKKTPAIQCEAEGRYSPFILVCLPNEDMPLAQMEVQPTIRLCTQHATSRINDFFTKAQWRVVQEQVMKQSQQLVHFNDAKIMYMDHHSQTIVPPPNPAIEIVS